MTIAAAAALAPTAATADPTFGVMNASGGIYWRSAPDWNAAEAVAGNGFYPTTTIAVHCYQSGAGNVPGSADTMWEQASVAGGPGTGSGWINEHFINDGSAINQPSPGVPACSAPPPTPPAPPPVPTPAPLASGQFHTQNASGGIYWRSAPDWNTAEAVAGNGFYPDTIIAVSCYESGAGNVPGSTDTMWEKASIAGGSGSGSGWINEHFIDDGAAINQPSPGVPACGPTDGGGGTTGGGGGGTTSLPGGGSIFFLPMGNDTRATVATRTIAYPDWRGSNCTLKGGLPTTSGKRVTTLAGWSNGRLGPIYYLNAASPSQRAQINYVLLIDPGGNAQFSGSCDETVNPSQVLHKWLALNPQSSRVVIIAAQSTNNDGRAGLDKWYLKDLSASQRSKQLLICNEKNLPHLTAFDQYASPGGANTAFIAGQKFQCPYGIPTVGS